MSTNFREKILETLKENHNSAEVLEFYKNSILNNFKCIFDFTKYYQDNKNIAKRYPKTDLDTLNGSINLLFYNMKLSNEIAFDLIKDKSYAVIESLTLTSVLFLLLDENDSVIFNEIIFRINKPKDEELSYGNELELLEYYCFNLLPAMLIGTKEI